MFGYQSSFVVSLSLNNNNSTANKTLFLKALTDSE